MEKKPAYYKAKAREALKGNWKTAIIITLCCMVLMFIPYLNYITSAISIWMMFSFLDLYRRKENWTEIGDTNTAIRFFCAYVVVVVFTFLWTLLLIVPGIIKTYAYSQTYFILRDNPKMSIMDGIKASEKMMMGHKMELFLIVLSFIGWALLSVITLGLAYFYVIPYMHTTMAVYYEELKKTTVIGEQQAETSEDTVIV